MPAPAKIRDVLLCGAVVLLAGLLLGAATSFAQGGVLPQALAPLANSVSGWPLITALLVWLTRQATPASAVYGAIGFLALVLGYTLAAELRGFPYHPLEWGLIGVLAGPFVGTAACWLRREPRRAVLGAGLLAGIAIGEGVYGLLVIADTTGWFYWVLSILLGIALLTVILVRRGGPVLLGIGVTVLVAAAGYPAALLLG
ncbi:DUF6518 family protein [Sciscionella marina]|uniref:DUF6518 family protein n=1 Tax=Sciscionella marina TaxID=508770 RepID=UPI00038125B2|nr:DUF6518 family protein [Sciscionella marina]